MEIYGIILAGGKSTRMKQNKMLINYNGHPLIWWAINSIKPYVDHLIIVTGKYDQEIRDFLGQTDIEIVKNENYEKGMFSSVLTGICRTFGDFFIIPGDCPFVSGDTFKALLNGHEKIRVPRYKNEDGHPIYISGEYKEELLSLPLDYNLKRFRDSKNYEIINVEDKNIVINLNYILDLEKLS